LTILQIDILGGVYFSKDCIEGYRNAGSAIQGVAYYFTSLYLLFAYYLQAVSLNIKSKRANLGVGVIDKKST